MGGHRASSGHLDTGVPPLEAGGGHLWSLGSGWDPHDLGFDPWVPYPTAMSIQKIVARQILDSRGNPTVEVDLFMAKGMEGWGGGVGVGGLMGGCEDLEEAQGCGGTYQECWGHGESQGRQ